MTTQDFSETNDRDYELYEDSTGRKYHKGADKEYATQRNIAYNRENAKKRDRSDYAKEYYRNHSDEIKEKQRENYDSKKNTDRCRKWRAKNSEKKKAYDRERYLRRKEEKLNAERENALRDHSGVS